MTIEKYIQRTARQFPYPPTPPIVAQRQTPSPVNHRLRALAIVAIIGLVVMVTPLRAAVIEWLRIGVVTVLVGPTEEPSRLPSLVNLFGETTLNAAQENAGFPLQVPAALGLPDHIYQQETEFNTVIMVWNDPPISLYQIGPVGELYYKFALQAEHVIVNGFPAIWTDLPHTLQYEQNGIPVTQTGFLVEGHVLIWNSGRITYRLESHLELEDVIAIAEALEANNE